MALTSFAALQPVCAVELPGISGLLLESILIRAGRQLCLTSSCWNELQEQETTAGVLEYDFDLPIGAELASMLAVTIGDSDMNVTVGPSAVTLTEEQAAYGLPLKLLIAFQPLFLGGKIESTVLNRHADTLCAGAKSIAMAMPGQPWTNADAAVMYSRQFELGIVKARADQLSGTTYGSLQMRPREFGY